MVETNWLFLLTPSHCGGTVPLALTNAMEAEKLCHFGANAAAKQMWLLHLPFPLLPQLVAGTYSQQSLCQPSFTANQTNLEPYR